MAAEIRGVTVTPPVGGTKPLLTTAGIVNAASAKPQLAPGAYGTIYGERLAKAVAGATTVPLPSTLGGVVLIIRGVRAPLIYVSPNQVNFQVPWTLPVGPAAMQITVDGVTSNSTPVTILGTAPGIFVVTHANGSLVSITNPARQNEVLVAYATGLGAVRPNVVTGAPTPTTGLVRTLLTPSVSIDNVACELQFSGLTPGLIGVNQLNFRVPANAKTGDVQVLLVTLAGQSSQGVQLSIR